MAAGIRTSTTTDWLPNAGIAPSSDRTAPGRTSRFFAPDRSPAGNAWCLGSSRESRARQASCDRRQQSPGSAPLTGLAPRSNSFGSRGVVSPTYMRHWLYTTSPATIRPIDGTCRDVVSGLSVWPCSMMRNSWLPLSSTAPMKSIESCSHGAAGNIWCPNKVSKILKTAPGLVVIFVKKPTWWQPHVAGELSFRGTLRIVGCVLDLNHSIGKISWANMLECCAEEFSLTKRRYTGNNNDHTRMQRFLSMESKKVGTIVRYKRVILRADSGHQLPVFRTTETEIVDMMGYVTSSMRQFNQRSVQALIDQKFHPAPERPRARRVTRIGFCFAHEREAGRPRRGKA